MSENTNESVVNEDVNVVRASDEPAVATETTGGESVPTSEDPVSDPVAEAKQELSKMREQLLRVAADFDNYRKRSRREIEDAAKRAKQDVLKDLLPVFDNMERAVSHGTAASDADPVVKGVRMVMKQFADTTERLGVVRVKSVGEVFDPAVHEAIQQVETSEQAAGTIVTELLPGYLFGEQLLRAAMVVVAKAPAVAVVEAKQEAKDGPDTQESAADLGE